MFKLICMKCGKEVLIEKDEKGHFVKNGISIFQTILDNTEIECECGNIVIL